MRVASASHLYGATEIGFTFPPEPTEINWQNIGSGENSLQDTGIGKNDHQEVEDKQNEFYNCPSLQFLESFQTIAGGSGTQAEPRGLSELKSQSVGLGRPRLVKFAGQTTRKEKAAQKENARHVQRAPSIQQSTDQCECTNKLP